MSDEVKAEVKTEEVKVDEGQSNDVQITTEASDFISKKEFENFKKDYAGLMKAMQKTQKENIELKKSVMSAEDRLKEDNKRLSEALNKERITRIRSQFDLPEELETAIFGEDEEEMINKAASIQKIIVSLAEKEAAKRLEERIKQGSKTGKGSSAEPKKEYNVEEIRKKAEFFQKNMHRMNKEEKQKFENEFKQITGA